jgi:Amt family ammonium transporter
VDRSEHAESAYDFADLGQSRFSPFGHHVPSHPVRTPPADAAADHAAAPARSDKQESLV